ncbi:conserved hypothetical protein [Streptomyces sviceus ATCC 29083]|uniref:Uncharacterized protein n=1 Tax=Streptomyces sviceus (strain ATCC 29083 / DSM 924 / JCM 4929 / NBRC 13980 / NCIMB 11184 / NRRL 5439 / UC 5370) TaxID=463191 RepID=B5HUR9_STRX2|nr:hypothetical protein [Streptomyces sp. CC0208]EDY56574.1 conserved hypothetical protein [Streptomyces sviceus ATCC 29083]
MKEAGLGATSSASIENELREAPDPQVARTGIDLVADSEAAYGGADPRHDAGHVVAERERGLVLQKQLELPVADHLSSGLMLAALTLTRTSRSPTVGSGTSAARAPFLPYISTTNAFMAAGFLRGRLGVDATLRAGPSARPFLVCGRVGVAAA